MKTAEKKIEKTAGRFGRCVLAALLISFTCVSPLTYSAFAEETDTTPITEEAPSPNENETADITDSAATDETNETSSDEATATSTEPAETTEEVALNSQETTTPATTEDSHTFNIGTTLDLMDAFKYDINTQSGQNFVINLTDDITLVKPADKFDTHGKKLFIGTDRLDVKNGNTVTILGHGHTIYYNDNSVNNLSLGTYTGSNLILGSADGSDSLTITFNGSDHQIAPLLTVTGGTLTINDGVTLSNNVNFTGLAGGAVNVQNNGVVYMNGGLIENCRNVNIPYGGGVAVEGGEFHMSGGTIKGSSEPDMSDYHGSGGGVAIGLHGSADVFTMSGDAVIEGNSAQYGGGVYVGPNSTFTMSDNAAIKNNTAAVNGGGVYVEQSATFTMGENNTITGNTANYGGGILNFGDATVTNIYDNNATTAGADIYNGGTITMDDVHDDWALSSPQYTSDPNAPATSESGTPVDNTKPDLPGIKFMSLAAVTPSENTLTTAEATNAQSTSNTNIDGWYYDGHRVTDQTDDNGNAVIDRTRWNAGESTDDLPQYLVKYTPSGESTNEIMGLKAAHNKATEPAHQTEPETQSISVIWENEDGTILYTMNDVDPADVPAADEYNELSGNANPTEPDENDYSYDFEGWIKTGDGQGDVIYIADYKAVPETHPTDTPSTPDKPDKPDKPGKPDVPNTPVNPNDNTYVVPDQPTPSDPETPTKPAVPSFPTDEPAHSDKATTPASDDGAQTTDEGSHAPRLGDDFLPLVATTGVATGLALLALDRARRDRKEN